jgi:hypothetical protein
VGLPSSPRFDGPAVMRSLGRRDESETLVGITEMGLSVEGLLAAHVLTFSDLIFCSLNMAVYIVSRCARPGRCALRVIEEDTNSPFCGDWTIALPIKGDERLYTGSSMIACSYSGVFPHYLMRGCSVA